MDEHYDPAIVGDDDVHVNRWCAIEQALIEDIDGNKLIFQEMKNLSKHQFGCIDDNVIPDGRAYFDGLRNNLDEFERIDFLINLTTYMGLHIDLGTIEVSNMLKEHRVKLENFRQQCYDEGLIRDKYFIGREQDIHTIQQMLTKGEAFGVCICGLGGMGKTSMAREVCIKLWKRKERWVPKKVDLREVDNLRDLLRDTLMRLGEIYGDTREELLQQFFNVIKNEINTRTILLLDNIDDAMAKDRDNVLNFLKEFVDLLGRLGTESKVRLIVTSRQKLLVMEGKEPDQHNLIMPEVELKSLSESESVKLLRKCTSRVSVAQGEAEHIVKLCGCCPLAIRAISSSLKNRLITPQHVIKNLQYGLEKTCTTEVLKVRQCIQQTFETMDSVFQSKLINLSVFKTASYDVKAASAILQTNEEMAAMDLLYLKTRHLIEEEDSRYDIMYLSDTTTENIKCSRYALHPVVHAFVTEKIQKLEENEKASFSAAMVNFLEYFDDIAQKAGREKDTNFMEFQTIVTRYRPHLNIFYDVLYSQASGHALHSSKIPQHNVISSKRISDTASFMLDDQQMIAFAHSSAAAAFDSGTDIVRGVYWKLQEGLALLEHDMINDVGEVIDYIEEGNYLENNENDEINAIIKGQFLNLKGRYCIHKEMYKEALIHLNHALEYYNIRSIKKRFVIERARIYNSIGTVHFRNPADVHLAKKNQQKALQLAQRYCHESHPDIANYMANVAACLFQEGLFLKRNEENSDDRFNKAIQLYNESIDIDYRLNRHKIQIKDYAMKLAMRANIHQTMKEFEDALKDNRQVLELRRRVFQEPHDLLTIATHRIGSVLREKGTHDIRMLRNSRDNRGEKEAMDTLFEAASYYDKVMSMIQDGGLSKHHEEEYMKIRDKHILLAKKLYDPKRQRKIEIFYSEYESGKYDKGISKKLERSRSSSGQFMTLSERAEKESSQPLPYSSDDESSTSSSSICDSTESSSDESNIVDESKVIKESNVDSSTSTTVETTSVKSISLSDIETNNTIKKIDSEKSSINTEHLDCPSKAEKALKHSLSYQSSMEDDVFSKPGQNKSIQPADKRRVSSGYQSGCSLSSVYDQSDQTIDHRSHGFEYQTGSTSSTSEPNQNIKRSSQMKRSISTPVSTATNEGFKKDKIKRSHSQQSQMTAFIEKIVGVKPKRPKLSKGLLGDSFNEEDEGLSDDRSQENS